MASYEVDTKKTIALVMILVFFILLSFLFPKMLISVIFIAVAAASMIPLRYVNNPIGFELLLFSTVMVSSIYGIFFGLFVGNMGIVAGQILNGKLDPRTLGIMGAISAVAVITGLSAAANIVILGSLMTLLYNIVLFVYYVMLGSSAGRVLVFSATNIPINVFLFIVVAPLLKNLLI